MTTVDEMSSETCCVYGMIDQQNKIEISVIRSSWYKKVSKSLIHNYDNRQYIMCTADTTNNKGLPPKRQRDTIR